MNTSIGQSIDNTLSLPLLVVGDQAELRAGSTGSTWLFLALLECCFSALLFCLLSLDFSHVRKLLFGLAALSRDNNQPPRPVTCCWTVVERKSHDEVNNKLPAVYVVKEIPGYSAHVVQRVTYILCIYSWLRFCLWFLVRAVSILAVNSCLL